MNTKTTLLRSISLFIAISVLISYAFILANFPNFRFISNTNMEVSFYVGIILCLTFLGIIFYKAFIDKPHTLLEVELPPNIKVPKYETQWVQVNDFEVHNLDRTTLFTFFILLIISIVLLGLPDKHFHGYWQDVLFWITVLLWTIGWTLRASEADSSKNNIVGIFSYFWFFLCVFMTIGTSFFEFAVQPIGHIRIFLKFTDLRLLVGILVGIFICCRAIGKAFKNRISLADIAKIPSLQLPKSKSYFLKPWIFILNIGLFVFFTIVNQCWCIVALIMYYIANLLKFIVQEIYEQYIRFEYLRMLLVVIIIISLFCVTILVTALNTSISNYFKNENILPPLIIIAILVLINIIIMLCSTIIIHDKEHENYLKAIKRWMENIASGIAYLISFMWLCGWVLYVITFTKFFYLPEFRHIGIFTKGATVLIIGSAVIHTIISKIKESRTATVSN